MKGHHRLRGHRPGHRPAGRSHLLSGARDQAERRPGVHRRSGGAVPGRVPGPLTAPEMPLLPAGEARYRRGRLAERDRREIQAPVLDPVSVPGRDSSAGQSARFMLGRSSVRTGLTVPSTRSLATMARHATGPAPPGTIQNRRNEPFVPVPRHAAPPAHQAKDQPYWPVAWLETGVAAMMVTWPPGVPRSPKLVGPRAREVPREHRRDPGAGPSPGRPQRGPGQRADPDPAADHPRHRGR